MTPTRPDENPLYQSIREPDTYRRAYNELMEEPPNRLRVRAVGEILRRITDPVHRVVDIACGGGAYVRAVQRAVRGTPSFVATDRQYACVGGYRLNHPEATGAMADVTRLPFRGGTFDLAMCLDIIEHLDDDVAFLREVGRLLRPGGWLTLSTHNSRSIEHVLGLLRAKLTGTTWLGWDPTHVRFYDEHSLRTKLEAAGFETVAFNGTYYLPFHLPARILSWPLECAGFRRAARGLYNAAQLPGYALNYPFEALSETGRLSTLGWGIVVLARWKGAAR